MRAYKLKSAANLRGQPGMTNGKPTGKSLGVLPAGMVFGGSECDDPDWVRVWVVGFVSRSLLSVVQVETVQGFDDDAAEGLYVTRQATK